MDDSFLMGSGQTIGDLNADIDRTFRRQGHTMIRPYEIAQGLSIHEFHRDEQLVIMLLDRIDRANVRMIQGRGGFGFLHEAGLIGGGGRQLRRKKFQGDVAVEDYLAKGYLPEALINFVALLGWNPGQGSTKEIYTLAELALAFDFAQVNKAGAVFDARKLDWLNAQYIKALPIVELVEKASPFLREKEFFTSAQDNRKTDEYVTRVTEIARERLTTLAEIGDEQRFLFVEPVVDSALLPWKGNSADTTTEALVRAKDILADIPDIDWTRQRLGEILLAEAGEKRGDFLWPLRVALSGAKQSPPPQDIAWVIGKDATLLRIRTSIRLISE